MNFNSAIVFDISRGSFHDGPGVRTVVYLKGCPLRCLWCHNPEGQCLEPQILYYPAKCIGCGSCVSACKNGLHFADENGSHVFDRTVCSCCGACAEVCPSKALVRCGKKMTSAEVFAEVVKDIKYFHATGGGVTVSGGEALLYPDFVAELFGMCRAEGIHTAVETSLYAPWQNVVYVLPSTDLLIADLKHIDSTAHHALTGAGNELILENFRRAAQSHGNIWIRIPLIPGLNDSDDNLTKSAEFIRSLGSSIKKVELLKFNNLYKNKYDALGLETPFGCEIEPQSDAELALKYDIFRRYDLC